MAQDTMSDVKGQASDAASAAGDKTQGATSNAQGAASGAQGTVQNFANGALGSIQSFGSSVASWGMGMLDKFFPPEQRAEFLSKLQSFMLANPKLSTFLGMNIALTGIPLGLFILFSITVAIFSLVVGLILGLLAAVLFTLTMVGIALSVVFPAIFFTTMAACFLFLWGLGGYYILKWVNGSGGDGSGDQQQAPPGQSIGDKLNAFTGGRLTGFMESARAEQAKGDISGYSDQHTKPKAEEGDGKAQQQQQSNGSAQKQD